MKDALVQNIAVAVHILTPASRNLQVVDTTNVLPVVATLEATSALAVSGERFNEEEATKSPPFFKCILCIV